MSKREFINEIIKKEGGYVNHPHDRGGETNFGITIGVARANGYMGEMKDMKREDAFRIYALRYWDVNRLDDMMRISPKITAEVADTGVLMGVRTSGKFLQRALNALNAQENYYDDIVVDGIVGSKTLSSLESFLLARKHDDGERVLLGMLNVLQGNRLIEITERREKNETFIFGWFKNRVI